MAFFGGKRSQDIPGYLGGQGIGDGMIERQQMEKRPQMTGYDPDAAFQGQSPFGNAPGSTLGQPQKKGFFGQGGVGRAIAGSMGDFLMQNAGMKPVYGPSVAQQRDMEHRAQIAEQQRMQGREDYAWKAQYDRANPAPVSNDTVNDLNWYKSLSEDDRALYHRMKPIVQTMADGSQRLYEPKPAAAAPVIGEIQDGHRFKGGNPADQSSWEPVGGPASQAPGNFRR